MTLNRRSLLIGGAATLGASAVLPNSRTATAGPKGPARRVLTILAQGGWDPTHVLDPKPMLPTIDAPDGTTQQFGELPIWTHGSRPAVTTFFQEHYAKCAVINGIQMQSIVHSDCMKRLLTGTASDANPDVGTITAYELGRGLPAPYLVLGSTAYTGPYASVSTRAGTVNQVRTLLDPAAAYPAAEATMPTRIVPDGDENAFMRQYLIARAEREKAVRGQTGANKRLYEDFLSSFERGDVLKGFSDGFGDDLVFTLELDTQIDLALDAMDRGVCYSAHLEATSFLGWDTHNDNTRQIALHDELYASLSYLVDQLETRGMLDDTLVVVVSEMGRTPRLNNQMGKDHWPVTSALLLGAGVKHGLYGQSSDAQAAMNVDYATGKYDENGAQLTYTNLAAGLLSAAGVDPALYLPNSTPFEAFIA